MSALSVALVLLSAVAHAGWNLLAKRVGADTRSLAFAWLLSALSVMLWAPVGIAALVLTHAVLTPQALAWIAGSATIHLVYFVALQRGYRHGDFSVVYPVARGTGPLLATLGAIVLLGERPSALALVGAGAVSGGVILAAASTGGSFQASGLVWAIVTGVTIAIYTVWDAHAIRTFAVPVVVYDWTGHIIRTALTSPALPWIRPDVARLWRRRRGTMLAIAALSPLAYVLVLFAVRLSPVSHVAPLREVGILVGAWLGNRALKEGRGAWRLLAAGLIGAGAILLTLG